jgi:hypothetical protein
MEAEIVFLNPNNAGPGCTAPIEHGFEVEVLDSISEDDSRVWIIARIATELDGGDILDLVANLTDPLGGDVLQAGPAPIERLTDPAIGTNQGLKVAEFGGQTSKPWLSCGSISTKRSSACMNVK